MLEENKNTEREIEEIDTKIRRHKRELLGMSRRMRALQESLKDAWSKPMSEVSSLMKKLEKEASQMNADRSFVESEIDRLERVKGALK